MNTPAPQNTPAPEQQQRPLTVEEQISELHNMVYQLGTIVTNQLKASPSKLQMAEVDEEDPFGINNAQNRMLEFFPAQGPMTFETFLRHLRTNNIVDATMMLQRKAIHAPELIKALIAAFKARKYPKDLHDSFINMWNHMTGEEDGNAFLLAINTHGSIQKAAPKKRPQNRKTRRGQKPAHKKSN